MLHIRLSVGRFLMIAIVYLLLFGFVNCTVEKEKGIVQYMEQLDKEDQYVVQLAELKIASDQLEPYLKMLKEGIQTSLKEEPGVLTLYAMEDQEDATKIKVLEIYANEKAYQSHIASAHFKKYKNGTLHMVESLTLTRTNPIIFAAKRN